MLRFQSPCRFTLAAAVMVTLGTSAALAAPVVVPPGLNPGDSYRLVFITNGNHDAVSTNIADYDSFVTDEANFSPQLAAVGATWLAVVATAGASANLHIGSFNVPVYNLAGQLVASDSNDLWDFTLTNPINYDQYGDQLDTSRVCTGAGDNGLADATRALGTSNPYTGCTNTGPWMLCNQVGFPQASGLPLFAISSTLVVPQAVPEPGTLGLLAAGLALLGRRQILRLRARL